MKRHHKKLKIGKIIRPRTYSPLTVKAFEEGKDNPDHILGIAHRDSKTDDLYVIDRCTNCKYNIINHEYEYEGKKCIKYNKKKELVCCKECHDDLCMTIKEAYD